MATRTAVVYLQIQEDDYYPRQAKVVRTTQNKPESRLPNTVVVKLAIEIPQAAFDPLQPTATIRIPEELVQHPEIEVTAEDPHED